MSQSLKIALYVNSYLPSIGGREVVVHHLAKALQILGHDVTVIGPGGWWRHRKMQTSYPLKRWARIPLLSKERSDYVHLCLHRWFKGFDVLHAHNTYVTGYVGALIKQWQKLPLVITPHGEDIHVIPDINHGLRLNPELDRKIRFSVESADYLTAISDAVIDSSVDAGASVDKINLIPNGIDLTRFETPIDIDVRAKYGIDPDAKVILTVGNYVRRRGQEELVEAMQTVTKVHPKATLVVVGRGTEVLQAQVDQLGLQDKVVITGAIVPTEVSGEDVVGALYQTAQCYTSAGMAEGAEGLSLALLDAMAVGVPIVATRISGNQDVIVDNENGLLVEPGKPATLAEGLIRMLDDQALAERCGQRAQEDAQPYSWVAVAEQYVAVYRKAMRQTRSR